MNNSEIIRLSAHEINTSIAIIHGYADLINCGIIKGADIVEMTGKIKDEAKKLARFVDELSNYVGLYIGERCEDYQDIVLEKLFLSVAAEVKESHIEDVEIRLVGSGEIKGIEEYIKELITELLNNSIIYNNKSDKKIYCSISNHRDRVIMAIEDNGCGIRKEDRDAVFECFYRVDKEASREIGGNGMGLAICKRIAELHNADISIDKSALDGTKVIVAFHKEERKED